MDNMTTKVNRIADLTISREVVEEVEEVKETSQEIAQEMLDVFHKAWNKFKWLKQEIRKCQLQEQDVLHVIENEIFTQAQGHKLCKKIKEIREHQRKLKNELEQLETLTLWTSSNIKEIYTINTIMKKKAEQQESRVYFPRIIDKKEII